MVAGIGVNQAGTVAVVANFYNDSISVVDLKSRTKTGELDLRPGVHDQAKSGIAAESIPIGSPSAAMTGCRFRAGVIARSLSFS